MTTTLSQDHHPTLRHDERAAVGVQLQQVLVTLIDLSLTGKQAHWNVIGPHFRALHLQLDEMVDAWREASDAVAERAVALGHAPDGRAASVVAASALPELAAGPQRDAALVRELTATLTDAVGVVRAGMDRIEDVDTVSADLLHGVCARLEEQLWMIRVQAG